MSSIDKRIVEMQFENSQFEKGVRQTMKSIEDLEDSLQFEKAEKGLNNLKRVGDSFSLAHMADGIDAVTEKFSTLGVIGKRVLENLTDSAMNWGKNFVSSMSIDQVSAGFDKYDTKVRSTKTIMNATGKDIGYVNEQLDRLNWFTDETSYSYGDMVSNIGKFTSMGIDLDSSVTSMQGIATWAALSGQGAQEASRAMYNMTQAMGTGKVALIDWKSIENANMATKEFKQTAIDTAKSLGILNAQGKTAKGTLVTYENFSQTLQEGWFTSDVLLKTLDKYGSAADEIYKYATEHNISAAQAIREMGLSMDDLGVRAFLAAQEARTFKDAIDATKDAVSTGWMKTFEYIFGNVEQATLLFTEFTEVLYELFAAGGDERNDLLAAWTDQEIGGRADLIQGLMDVLWGLVEVVKIVKDAFHALIPPATVETLQNISVAVKEFGANFREAVTPIEEFTGRYMKEELFHYEIPNPFEEFAGEMKKGSKDKEAVRLMQERLIKLGYNLDKFGADGIWGPETQAAFEQWQKDNEMAVTGIYDAAAHAKMGELLGLDNQEVKVHDGWNRVEQTIEKLPPKAQKFKDILMGVFSAVHIVWNVLATGFRIIGYIINLLSPLGEAFLTIGSAIGQSVTAFDKWLTEAGVFDQWFESAKKFLEPFGEWVKVAADALLRFFGLTEDTNEETMTFVKLYSNIKEAIKKTGIIDKLSVAWDKFKKAFSGVVEIIKKRWGIFKNTLGEGSKGFLESLPDTIASVVEWLGNLVSKGLDLISPFIAKIPSAVEKIKNFWAALTQKGDPSTGQAPGFLIKVRDAFKSVIDFLFGDGDVNSGKQPGILKKAWQLITGNLEAFTEGMDEETKKSVLEKIYSVRDFFQKIGEALFYLFGGKLDENKKISDDTLVKIDNFKKSIGSVFEAIGVLFTGKSKEDGSLSKETVDKIIGIRNTIGGVFKAIGGFLADIFKTIKGLITGEISFSSIGEFFSSLWEKIKGLFASISGIASENLGTTWENIKKFFSGLWTNILKFGKWLIIGFAVYKVIKFIGSITGAFNKLKEVIGSYKKNAQPLSKTVMQFAFSIALIAGSIWLIGQLDQDQFTRGVAAVGGIIAAIGALLAMCAFFKGGAAATKAIKNLGTGIRDLAIGIGIIALAIFLMGRYMDAGTFAAGFSYLSIIMGALFGFMVLLKYFGATDVKLKGFYQIAIVIGVMAIIVKLLGGMPLDQLGKGLFALLVIMGLLGALFIVIGKLGGGKVKMKGLWQIAVVIAVMGMVVKRLGKMNPDKLKQGLIAITILMALIAGIVFIFGKYGKDIKTGSLLVMFIGIAAVIWLFGETIKKLKDVDPSVMYAFSISLAIALGAFVAACMIIGKMSGGPGAMIKGALAIAGAIGILASAVVILVGGLGELDKLTNGGVIDAIEQGGKVLEALAGAIGPFTDSLEDAIVIVGSLVASEVIGKIPGGSGAMLKGALSISGALGMLAGAVVTLVGGIGEIDKLTEGEVLSAIQNGGVVLKAIDDAISPFEDSFETLGIIAGVFLALSEIVGLIPGGPVAMIAGSATVSLALGMLVIAVTGLVAGLGALDEISDGALVEAINAGGEVLEAVGTAIGKLVSGFNQVFIQDLNDFGDAIGNVADNITGMNEDGALDADLQKALDIATTLHDFFADLDSYPLTLTGLGTYVTAASELDSDMADFGAAIGSVRDGVKGLDEDETIEADTAKAIAIAATLKGFFDDIAEQTPDGQGLIDYNLAVNSVLGDVETFGSVMNSYHTNITGFNSETIQTDTDAAIKVVSKIAGFLTVLHNYGNSIEKKKGVIDRFVYGENTQDTVFDAVKQLGENMVLYQQGVALLDPSIESKTDTAKSVVTKIKDLIIELHDSADKIQNKGGVVVRLFTGENTQDTVFGALKTLGENVGVAKEGLKGIGPSFTKALSNAAEAIEIVTKLLQDLSGDEFDYDLNAESWVVEGVKWLDAIVAKLIEMDSTVKSNNVDISHISVALNAITRLSELLAGEGSKQLSTENFLSGLDVTSITTQLETFSGDLGIAIQGVVDGISDYLTNFSDAGADLVGSLSEGMSTTPVTGGSDAAKNMLDSVNDYKDDFDTAGRNFALGLSNGVAFRSYAAVRAAETVARQMVNAARRVFNEHSPSKVAEQIGEYFTEGLAIGTTNKVGEATNAASDVADSMLSTASGTLSTLSSLLADDIDVNPVIAPVVDLTNAKQSAAMIGGLFGNQSFGVTSQIMATRAMDSTANGRPVTIQNGTLSTTESLGGVTDQLNALTSYLTARNDGPHTDEMQSLSERFGDLADAVSNLKIVLDTGALVGQITPALDTHLGSLANRRDRGN